MIEVSKAIAGNNLKQAAKTMNFLTENNIKQYEDLISRIDEIVLDSEQTADNLKQVEKKLSDMSVMIKNISTYQKTKDIYRGYIKAKNKDAYRRKHESSLILYEAATKALKDVSDYLSKNAITGFNIYLYYLKRFL